MMHCGMKKGPNGENNRISWGKSPHIRGLLWPVSQLQVAYVLIWDFLGIESEDYGKDQ